MPKFKQIHILTTDKPSKVEGINTTVIVGLSEEGDVWEYSTKGSGWIKLKTDEVT